MCVYSVLKGYPTKSVKSIKENSIFYTTAINTLKVISG